MREKIEKIIEELPAKELARLSGASVSSTQQWKQKNASSRNWQGAKAIYIVSLLENYEAEKGKIRSLSKQQWLNNGTLSRNAEEAKEFLAHNIYDWKTKESALNSLKHAFKQGEKTRLSLQGKSTELGSEPENYVSWLAELTVKDMADK